MKIHQEKFTKKNIFKTQIFKAVYTSGSTFNLLLTSGILNKVVTFKI